LVSPAAVLSTVHAEPVACALRDRVLGLGADSGGRFWRGVLLTSGTGSIRNEDETENLTAPCLAWLPWNEGQTLRIKAGGVGYQLSIEDQLLANAIGRNPESADLRFMLDRQVVASLLEAPDAAADAEHAFDVIVREIRRPRTGSWTMVQAQVRAILVLLWRLSGAEDDVPQARGQATRSLIQFRQLLEAHFRDRWSIQRYAAELGMSPDRLHDICRRELDRTPLQLVHERLVYEARLRLERSTQTVEQVAGSLGFRDVGHFSRFFKSNVGLPPGAYRNRAAQAVGDESGMAAVNYVDWP